MAAAKLSSDQLLKLARVRVRKSVICSYSPYVRADVGRVYEGPKAYEKARGEGTQGGGRELGTILVSILRNVPMTNIALGVHDTYAV